MMGIVVQKATVLNTQLTLCTVYIILDTQSCILIIALFSILLYAVCIAF